MTTQKRAVLYLRVSTDHQSVENQNRVRTRQPPAPSGLLAPRQQTVLAAARKSTAECQKETSAHGSPLSSRHEVVCRHGSGGAWAMRGSLGEKIGEGGSADIHAWAPGQVVKLFKPARGRQRLSRHEAQMTRAAFAAGLPAPEVFDEVTLEGRFGIVMSRFDGPTLLQLLQTRAMTPEQAGAILAALSISVHKTPPPPDVISLRDLIQALLQSPGNLLPKHLATGVLALLENLPPGDGLCHGDLLAGNVIMT